MRAPAYPTYKDSGIEWLGQIPAHWEAGPIKRWLSSLKDGTHGSFERVAVGIPLLSAKNVGEDGRLAISEAESQISEADFKEIDRNGYLKPGDLLLTIVGTIGRAAVFRCEEPVAFQRSVAVLRPADELDVEFLFHAVQSPSFQLSLRSSSKQSAQGGVYLSDIAQIPLLVPTQPEQQAIADFLDRETAKIDALVEKKERLIELLQEKRTALITHAVTQGLDPKASMKDSGIEWLGQIPAHWFELELKFALSEPITDGPHETPEFLDEGIPFLSAESVKNSQLDFEKKRGFISEEDHHRYSRKYSPRRGDVYMVKSGATTGNVARVETDEVFDIWSPLAAMRPDPSRLTTDFLFFFLKSEVCRKSVELSWSFGTQQNIGMGVLSDLRAVVPSLEEQQIITGVLEDETAKIDALIAKVGEAIERLKEYRTALISAAVTGKIDVRDESRTPA